MANNTVLFNERRHVSTKHSFYNLIGSGQSNVITLFEDNVGIGTTAPRAKLDVTGDIRFSGIMYDEDDNAMWIPGSTLQWMDTTAPAFTMPTGATLSNLEAKASYRYIGNEVVYNFNTNNKITAAATISTDNYTLMLPQPLKTAAYATDSVIGDLLLSVTNAAATLTTTYKAYALVNADNSKVTIRYLNGTTDASLAEFPINFTFRLQGTITYTSPNIANNTPLPSTALPGKFVADQDGRVAFNTGVTASARFDIKEDSATVPALKVTQAGTGDILQVMDGTTSAVVVKDGGNVGIGTTNPLQKLHVVGNTRIQGDAIVTGNWEVQGTTTYIDTYTAVTSNVTINNASGNGPALRVTQSGVGANYPIADFYDSDVSTTVPALRIADGGNVGIGTGTPLNKLHVEGALRLPQRIMNFSWSTFDVAYNSVSKASIFTITDTQALAQSIDIELSYNIPHERITQSFTTDYFKGKVFLSFERSQFAGSILTLRSIRDLRQKDRLDWGYNGYRNSLFLNVFVASKDNLIQVYAEFNNTEIDLSAGRKITNASFDVQVVSRNPVTIQLDDYNSPLLSLPTINVGASSYALIVKEDNVGIGTTNPAQKLHVQGNILSSGSTSAGTQFLGLATDTLAAPSFSFTGDANTGMYHPGADKLGLVTGGIERVSVLANGNVGIGTTNPRAKLQVLGSVEIDNDTSVTRVNNTITRAFNRSLGTTITDATNICQITAMHGAYGVSLSVVHSESSSSECKLYHFAVSYNSTFAYWNRINPISSNTNGIDYWAIDINTNENISTLRIVRLAEASSSSNFTCSVIIYQSASSTVTLTDTSTTSTGVSVSAIYKSTPLTQVNGNVGIGTTNPQAKLHVNGTFIASGTVIQAKTSHVLNNSVNLLYSGTNEQSVATLISFTPISSTSTIIINVRFHALYQGSSVSTVLFFIRKNAIGVSNAITSTSNAGELSVNPSAFGNSAAHFPFTIISFDKPATISTINYIITVQNQNATTTTVFWNSAGIITTVQEIAS